MWSIFLDGEALHVPGTRNVVINPKLTQGANNADSLSFTVPRDHPLYNVCADGVLNVRYTVERDGVEVSRGRVLSRTLNPLNATLSVTCEGELAYLNDSVLMPYDFSGAPSLLFSRMLDEHNAQCDSECRLLVGNVTVQDPNNYIVRGSESPTNLMAELLSKTCNSSTGGWLNLRRVNGATYLDWLDSPTAAGTQSIAKGSNLLDIADELDGAKLVTAIYPIGQRDGAEYVKLPTGSDGRMSGDVYRRGDFAYSKTLVNAYGWHAQCVQWDDVTTPTNLRTRAINYVSALAFNSNVTLSALDLRDAGYNVDAFEIGQRVAVSCDTISGEMVVTGATWALDDPAATTFEFGSSLSLTQSQSDIESDSTGGGGWSSGDKEQYIWHYHADTDGASQSTDFTAIAPIAWSEIDEPKSDNFIIAHYNGYDTPRIITTAGEPGQWSADRFAEMRIFGGSNFTQFRVPYSLFRYEQGAVQFEGQRYTVNPGGANDPVSLANDRDYFTLKWRNSSTTHAIDLTKDGIALTGSVTVNGEPIGSTAVFIQKVEASIVVPSTAPGRNAANLTATVSLEGYTPMGVMGWRWSSGTRQNFFHIYRMDVSADGTVTVSVCNFHSTDNANGTIVITVLMVGDDYIPDYYRGTYQVTPMIAAQSLDTDGKVMSDDVSIDGIPRYDTANQYGTTTIIGDGNGN